VFAYRFIFCSLLWVCGAGVVGASSRPPAAIVLDSWRSPRTGAISLTTGYRLFESASVGVVPLRLWEERGFVRHSSAIGVRFARLALIDEPCAYAATVFQHEYFGHGARCREIGFKDTSFRVRWPRPYGTGGGSTSYGRLVGRAMGYDDLTTLCAAGTEASLALARETRLTIARTRRVGYAEALLYLHGSLDLFTYIRRTGESEIPRRTSNDILYYLYQANRRIPGSPPAFTVRHLKRQSLWTLADPYLYLSAYTVFVQYAWRGREDGPLPMIPAGRIRFLPSVQYGLTPFGPEYRLTLDCATGTHIFSAYFRTGDSRMYRFWGTGIGVPELIGLGPIRLGGTLEFWNQPALWLGGPMLRATKEGSGAAIGATVMSGRIDRLVPIGLTGEILFKGDGYLPGEKLARSTTVRLGFGIL
jgi:hypothetical protein